MSSRAMYSRFAEAQGRILSFLDASSETFADDAVAIRGALTTSVQYLAGTAAPAVPTGTAPEADEDVSNHCAAREQAVEVFHTLFEVYERVAGAGQPSPALDELRTLTLEIFQGGVVEQALAGIKNAAAHHATIAKALQDDNAKPTPATDDEKRNLAALTRRRKQLLVALTKERVALASLVHAALRFRVPKLDVIQGLVQTLAQLQTGDSVTVPLTLVALAAIRVSDLPSLPAVATARLAPATQAAASSSRGELAAASLEQLRATVANATFQQSGLKYALLLAVAVAEAAYRPHNSNDEAARKRESDALKSDAVPWLVTQLAANLPHDNDPLSLGFQTLYQSIRKEDFAVTRFVLDERLQDATRRELVLLVAHAITRCTKTLAVVRDEDQRELYDAENRRAPAPAGSPVLGATDAQQRAAASPRPAANAAAPRIRCNFEIFSILVSLVFEGHPEDSQQFWSGGLTMARFLSLATETSDHRLLSSAYHMIASVVNDQATAARAFEVILNRQLGTWTWEVQLSGLHHYLSEFQRLSAQGQHADLAASTVDLLVALLRVLRQVCRFDARARREIIMPSSMGNFDALNLLFNLLTCVVPLRLKAALMHAIGAIVAPKSGVPLEEEQHIVQRVWSYMESIAVVPQVSRAMGTPRPGISEELEVREVPLKHYPLTFAYLYALENLTPAASAAVAAAGTPRVSGQSFALVDNLGAPHRAPGVMPYYEYMLSDVFLKAMDREYVDQGEKWAILRSCLNVVCRCLVDFDGAMDAALAQRRTAAAAAGQAQSAHVAIRLLLSHPAFTMLGEILDGKPLLDAILRVISTGRATYSADAAVVEELSLALAVPTPAAVAAAAAASATPMFGLGSTVAAPAAPAAAVAEPTKKVKFPEATRSAEFGAAQLLALKIIQQVLQMQSKFLHELQPRMTQLGMIGVFGSSKRELDRLLATRQQALVDLVSLIQTSGDDVYDLGLHSVKILTALSVAPTFAQAGRGSPLVSVLSASNQSAFIKDAYRERFNAAGAEPEPVKLLPHDQSVVQSLRLATLQLLTHNLRGGQLPSLAHFLLGLTKDSQLYITDRVTSDGTLLSAIVEAAQAATAAHGALPKVIAEPIQEVIYRLISNPATFPVSAMLKSRNFFKKQTEYWFRPDRLVTARAANLSSAFMIPAADSADMARPDFRASTMSATPSKAFFTGPRSAVTPATPAGMRAGARGGAAAFLLGPEASYELARATQDTTATLGIWTWLLRTLAVQVKAHHNQTRFAQELIASLFAKETDRMTKVLQATMGVSVPGGELPVSEAAVKLYEHVNNAVPDGWPTFVSADGCIEYDIAQCERLAKQAAGAAADRVTVEGLLQHLTHENRKRRIYSAQYQTVKAWVDLVGVCLLTNVEAFGTPEELSETLVSLISVVTEQLRASPTESREHFAKLVLLLLRILDHTTVSSKNADATLRQILNSILEVCKSTESNLVVRGNMYAALLVYLGFTVTEPGQVDLSSSVLHRSLFSKSAAATVSRFDRSIFGMSTAAPRDGADGFLRSSGSDSILTAVQSNGGERLLDILTGDALNKGLWQTVSLALLDVLCQWSLQGATGTWVLEYLDKRGFVQRLVSMLRTLDNELARLCSSEDPAATADLASLFIYESLMALFLRLSMHRATRAKLIESALVSVLAESSCFTYLVGNPAAASATAAGAAKSGSDFMDVDASAASKQADPYLYFSGTLAEDRVSETLRRYNQVLQPALNLLVTLTSLHLAQTASSTVPDSSFLVKSVTQFVGLHAASLQRVVRACAALVNDHVPLDDNDLEMAVLCQAEQIASLARFLARQRVPVPAELAESLLVLFVRATRAELNSATAGVKRSAAAEVHLLRTSSHIIGYCFALAGDKRAETEPVPQLLANGAGGQNAPNGGEQGRFDSRAALNAAIAASAPLSRAGVRFMFDPDLAAAKDRYYSTSNRLTLGLLVLYIQQVIARLRVARVEADEVATKLQQQRGAGAGVSQADWNKYILERAVLTSDVASHVAYEVIPADKRAELFVRKLAQRARDLALESVSHIRVLEMSLALLFVHIQHYTTGTDSRLGKPAAAGGATRGGVMVGGFGIEDPNDVFASRASQRFIITLNNIKIDAASVFPELKKALSAVAWTDEQRPNLAFLSQLCDKSLALISEYNASS
ncbi:hypothetical protein H9P43_003288 [Blastocladiella emersonii ATCC 22665]|nr:hypothetical protein H9P43_003288 [Blastocladiella emersonii ATCC 22665]